MSGEQILKNPLKRVIGVAVLMIVVTGVAALIVNLLLFRFGPWADVWPFETWGGLLVVGTVIAYLTKNRWLSSPGRDRV